MKKIILLLIIVSLIITIAVLGVKNAWFYALYLEIVPPGERIEKFDIPDYELLPQKGYYIDFDFIGETEYKRIAEEKVSANAVICRSLSDIESSFRCAVFDQEQVEQTADEIETMVRESGIDFSKNSLIITCGKEIDRIIFWADSVVHTSYRDDMSVKYQRICELKYKESTAYDKLFIYTIPYTNVLLDGDIYT